MVFANQYFLPDEAATSQMLTDLVFTAVRAGHACRVVASDRSYRDGSVRYPRRDSLEGIEIRRVPTTAFSRASAPGRLANWFSFLGGASVTLLRGERPDVIVGMSTPALLGTLAVAVGRLRGARSAYWAMDVYPDLAFELGALRRGGIAGRVFAFLSRWTLRSADVVIALGETMETRLKEAGARNVVAVHNWADGEAIRPMPSSESHFRRAYGWDGKFVVLYSGNLGLAHEFDTLVGAAAILRDETDLLIAVVGDGPRKAELERAVRDRNLQIVRFHPAVSRSTLGHLLAAGDSHIVTLRPRMPGLLVPSKIYGILAAGRPALYVGPKEGEVFNIVTRADCGVCIENGDSRGLADAIRRLRDDGVVAREMGRRARELFDREFTREGQTKKLLATLTNLAAGSAAAGG
ncbi:MAG TPA: glycosyltransferase family 4 protein [Thermoanaerobaculia bacterium]|nr:glycosyltransferase family 4 protein [Thermoanaerobaculia bacterium]